jgi:glycosyltransferase involved in cell wall biosynthesis
MRASQFLEFKWKYSLTFLFRFLYRNSPPPNKFLFVTHNDTKGWILEAKAIRLSTFCDLPSEVYYSDTFRNLPDSEGYFYLHQKYFARALKYNPGITKRKNIVMFTHAEWSKRYSRQHMSWVLNFADKVICLNTFVHNELEKIGVDSHKLEIYHMASDPKRFLPKIRTGNGCVGFCMNFHERKNPELAISIIKNMPSKDFILIGPNWKKYEGFKEIENLSNFTYYDVPYEQYSKLYQKMDVFVSTSHLEGGPVPLLEAMLSNVVPVVSNTGFAPDLIRHGINGFLFESTCQSDTVIELITKAFDLKVSVREFALPHSWSNYGRKITDLFMSISDKK